MSMVTSSRARRLGTLIVLVGGLIAPIGTASAQGRSHENQREHRRGEGQWDRSRTGREEERIRAEELARQAADQAARLAAQERARQEYAQRVAAERARQEQARQEALRAAQLRAQQQQFAREQDQLRWERERAAQREAWMSAMRERREARLAQQRQRRAWVTVNRRVWQQQRGRMWTVDVRLFEGERRIAVRNELRRHALRTAYLTRLREVAGEVNEPMILERVDTLFEREQRRHELRMDRLGATANYPYGVGQDR